MPGSWTLVLRCKIEKGPRAVLAGPSEKKDKIWDSACLKLQDPFLAESFLLFLLNYTVGAPRGAMSFQM